MSVSQSLQQTIIVTFSGTKEDRSLLTLYPDEQLKRITKQIHLMAHYPG